MSEEPDEYIGQDMSHEEQKEVAKKIVNKAEEMGVPEKKIFQQVQAFGKIQRGVELLQTDNINKLVEILNLWRKMTGADNIDEALSYEEVRENMEMIAEIKEDGFNIPTTFQEDDIQ